MRRLLFFGWAIILGCALFKASSAQGQAPRTPSTVVVPIASPPSTPPIAAPPGDRVTCEIGNLAEWIPAALSPDSYRIGPGDTLLINVQGKATLDYKVRADAGPGENPNEATVTPAGEIVLPLLGKVEAAGKTAAELEKAIKAGLADYIRDFQVYVSVAKVHTVNIWISGEVENPGPRILPAVSTASLAALQARIKPTGSTRRITVIRAGTRRTLDLYRMTITGRVDEDIPLEPGDSIHVPPVTDYVEVTGEVVRPGRYEAACVSDNSDRFCTKNLVELCLGATPAAALDKAFIERIGTDGKKTALNIDLRGSGADTTLQAGDTLVLPSISAFQPIIRLIGEFKGDGVYQRAPGTTATDIENRSGIYFLKQGQTAGDVIAATGGVTPQADLRKARIERNEKGASRVIPVDLERLLINSDKSADVALANGDTLILPAVANEIHVFGEVKSPGTYPYSPNRRLLDYLGGAGGPTTGAKLTDVRVVRGSAQKPEVTSLDAKASMRGKSLEGNPVLEPGDIVYVPARFISDWRDVTQLIFTSFTLSTLFKRL
jgi:protein involved in polysaccharide export with SLBB domain